MSQPIKAVLFDLDGTLLDTQDLILASFRYATTEVLGQKIPDELLLAKVGQPLEVQMCDFTDDPALQKELVDVYRDYNHAVHDERVRAFDGVVEMLDWLADAGYRMGVVTSKRQALAQRGLDVCGLAKYMEFVVAPDVFPIHKPDPAPVVHACELMGLDPAECLYVGDSPFDIAAGNGAGCETVAVTWGMFSAEVLADEDPMYVIGHPSDFANLSVLH
ncbi:MAG: HAD-IA family hydrolase [Eggerthellaceae bacterium]|nr:HAD-IA family hydrolase [Eggerthellaceae bacterium]